MKFKLIILFFLFFGIENHTFSKPGFSPKESLRVEKKRKDGQYKKKKHRLKKFFMGKRYCDCPKH
jgi:hypothetical protein